MILPMETFFSICQPMKLENELSPSKIKQRDRHRVDIPIPQRGNGKNREDIQAKQV